MFHCPPNALFWDQTETPSSTNGDQICQKFLKLCQLLQACVSYVQWWQGQLVSGSQRVCNSVYAAGQVSLLHVLNALQPCGQAMHHDRTHHPFLCHNTHQSYMCTSEPLQPCQTHVIAIQHWIWCSRPTGTEDMKILTWGRASKAVMTEW